MYVKISSLKNKIFIYMRRMEFASAKWDGNELTLYGHNGLPWSYREFNKGSYAKEEFERLETLCERGRFKPFIIKEDWNAS